MNQCLEGGQEGRGMGKNPESRETTGRWIGHARSSQGTSEPGDEVFSLSHLLQRRVSEIHNSAPLGSSFSTHLIPLNE